METQTPKKNRFSRKWTWIIAAALGIMLLGCVSCVGLAGAGIYGIVNLLTSHPLYREALQIVQNDSQAQEMLGTPIEAGQLWNGNIVDTGSTGRADISFRVSGPKGSGRVDVVAKKVGGEWIITLLQLVMDDTHERLLIIGEPVD
jgi:hypothetical protein